MASQHPMNANSSFLLDNLEVLDAQSPRNSMRDQKQVKRQASEKSSEYEMIDPDEDQINDFHMHHQLKKETNIKQKFMQKM